MPEISSNELPVIPNQSLNIFFFQQSLIDLQLYICITYSFL